MRKFSLVLAGIALFATLSCEQEKKSALSDKIAQYKLIEVATPDLSGITDNGKEVLNLYRFAADEADAIYWKQYFGDKSLIEGLSNEEEKTYGLINYGPWDRLSGEAFLSGYGQRPAGANFYPADLTREEFASWNNPDKTSPYTLIRRAEDGSLKTVWFHDEYKDNIDKICNYLQAAADITIKPSVRNYLLKKIEALKSDNYYESEIAWLDMDDSKMDLILGPAENSDDQLFGLKNSYEAFVLLKDMDRTEFLRKYIAYLPELQEELPCDPAYKTFHPGTESNIFACKALYYAGAANAGIKVIAINLPLDNKVQEEKGSRTILLENVLEEKFNRIVHPAGLVLLCNEQQAHLDANAFFWNIAMREVAHGLGVKETVNGQGSVNEALGEVALTWEEAKANIVGLYLSCKLIEKHATSALVTKEDAITTYLANLIRSERFGQGEALGRANLMIYNYLKEQKAFSRGEDGRYTIDFPKATEAISSFAGLILKTQATGDYEFAKSFEKKYAVVSDAFKADLRNLRLEGIPADLRFNFAK